jgi:hypothetical protein
MSEDATAVPYWFRSLLRMLFLLPTGALAAIVTLAAVAAECDATPGLMQWAAPAVAVLYFVLVAACVADVVLAARQP